MSISIPSLSRDLPADARVIFDNKIYRPGDVYEYDGDPCTVLSFINAAVQQVSEQFPDRKWNANADINQWTDLCLDAFKQALTELDNTLASQVTAPVAVPSSTASDEAPPGLGFGQGSLNDTPMGLGAPSAKTAVDSGPAIEVDDATTGLDPRDAGIQLRDPTNPRNLGEVADHLAGQGFPDPQIPDLLDAGLRGEPLPGEAHSFRSDPEVVGQTASADPVNLFTGEFTLSAVDLDIPGRGFSFRLERQYASGRPYYGPWGFNWDHNYNVYLRLLSDGRLAIRNGRLHEDVYKPAADAGGGAFDPPAGVHARLDVEIDGNGALPGYRIRYSGGLSWVFRTPNGWPDPARVPLVSIADLNGNALQFSYDAQGRLSRVLDTLNRPIVFEYGACGLLERVRDFTGRTVRYDHDRNIEHLVRVAGPAVDYAPDGVSAFYEYADPESHPALLHNIVRVLDHDGRTVLENTYGEDLGTDDFNRVVVQLYIGQEFTYSATKLAYAPSMPLSVNDPVLQVRELTSDRPLKVYTFGSGGNLIDERTRLIADGSYRIWAQSYIYTKWGDLAESRKPNGLALLRNYDVDNPDPRNRGNVLTVTRVAPPDAFLPERVIWQFTYDQQIQKALTATDERGSVYSYRYDNGGNLRRIDFPNVTLPDGTQQQANEQFTYNEFGQIRRSVSAEGRVRAYDYVAAGSSAGLLREISIGEGAEAQTLTFDYDAWSNIARIAETSGAETEYRYNAVGQIVEILRPADDRTGERSAVAWHYDHCGRLTGQDTPRGAFDDGVIADPVLRHVFDIDPLRLRQSATYWVNTATPQHWNIEQSIRGAPTVTSNPLGRISRFFYDERDLVISRKDSVGASSVKTTSFNYDRNGNMIRITDAAGRTIEYGYDAWDRLIAERLPGDPMTRTRVVYSYDSSDAVKSIETIGIQGAGLEPTQLSRVVFEFDERGRCVRREEGATRIVQWFDRDSQVVRTVDERGAAQILGYDALGRLRTSADVFGNSETLHYNVDGWVDGVEQREIAPGAGAPEVYVTTWQRDARGRIRRTVDPLGNAITVEFDDRDLPMTAIDPLGQRSEAIYTADGRLTRARAFLTRQRVPVDHCWDRDAAGRVLAYTDPLGRRTAYTYDSEGHWTRIDLPDGRSRLRVYNAGGDLESETSPAGATATHFYGSDGMLQRLHFVPDPTSQPTADVQLARDGLGRVIEAAQGTSVVNLAYDLLGRLARETSGGAVSTWKYDDGQGSAELNYPDGRVDRYSFDALGRLSNVTLQDLAAAPLTDPRLRQGSLLASYEYVGPQRLSRRQLGNGSVTTYGYDLGRRLESITHFDRAGTILAGVQYVHDANGRRRVALSAPAPGAFSWYAYDELSRLNEARRGIAAPLPPQRATQAAADQYIAALGLPVAPRISEFSLDSADERRSAIETTEAEAIQEDIAVNAASEIASITRTTPAGQIVIPVHYDLSGRRVADDRYRYRYDVLGHLREVSDLAGAPLLFQEFDALGRLASRTVGGQKEFTRHLGARPVQEDTGGVPLRQRCYGASASELVVKSQRGECWSHYDSMLSLLLVSDHDSTPLERYGYDAFGRASIWTPDGVAQRNGSAVGMTPEFAGYRSLGIADLYHARARIYDAATACFLQPDPRGNANGANTYVYAAQNPVDLYDPTGEVIPVILALVVILGAVSGAGYSFYDAGVHPEKYDGSFSWRALFNTAAGAVIGAGSWAAGEIVAAWAGVGTYAAGGGIRAFELASEGVGLARTLTLGQTFVLSGTGAAISGLAWRNGFNGLFPELVEPPSVGSTVFDYATGGALGLVFRAVEAIGNPFSKGGWTTIRMNLAEASARIKSFGWRQLGGVGYQPQASTERAAGYLREIPEFRVRRLFGETLQDPLPQGSSAVWREPGPLPPKAGGFNQNPELNLGGQWVVFNPEVDVPADSSWIEVKTGRVDMWQARYLVGSSPSGRVIYYVSPRAGLSGVVRDLYAAGVSEVRTLTPALLGAKPFPLPFAGTLGYSAGELPLFLLDPNTRATPMAGSGTRK
jgi:RHS repeat-associated protein